MASNKQLNPLFIQASQLLSAGQAQQALQLLSGPLKKPPYNAELAKWAGCAFTMLKQSEQALPLLQQALQEKPQDPVLLNALGTCYLDEDEPALALAYFQQSYALEPEDKTTLGGLALAHRALGEFDAAQPFMDQLLQLDPDYLDVLHAVSLQHTFVSEEEPRFLQLRRIEAEQGEQLDPDKLALLYSILGKAYEDLNQPQQAFDYYRQANELQKPQRRYSNNLQALFLAYQKFYTPGVTARLRQLSGLEKAPEIFICGMSRSGKSLVESLLACHPLIQAGGENKTFRKYAGQVASKQTDVLNYYTANPAQIRSDALRYFEQRNWPEQGRITNTLPANLEMMSFLGLWFPRAPIIFITRNLEDLGLAIYFKKYAREHAYSLDLYCTGREIAFYEALMDLWISVLPNPCIKLRYEDLVNQPARVSKALYEFLGLDWKAEYFNTLQEYRHLSEHLAPHQSLDAPAPVRNDYIGWSQPYQEFLEPLHRGYQEALTGDTLSSPSAAQPGAQPTALTTTQARALVNKMLNQHSVVEAARTANRLLQYNSKDFGFLRSLGIAASLAGKDEKAIPVLKYALQQQPKNPGLLANLVRACVRAGEFSQAQKYQEKLARVQADAFTSEQLALEIFVASGSRNQNKLKAFSARAQALLTQRPDDLDVRRLAAVLQARLGEVDAALEAMQQLLALLQQRQLNQPQVALSPQRTQILLDMAEAISQKQPGSDKVVDHLWRACQQYPYSRATQKAWQQLGKALAAAADPQLQALNQLHQRINHIWSSYQGEQLEFSFGDFGLPYQAFEPLKLAGTRPALYRLERYGLRPLLPANARALDIGCNHGYLLMGLADQLSLGRGFDISKACIEVGQTVAEHLQLPQIQLTHHTFDEFIAQPQEQYDLIIACAVHRWIGKPLPVFGQHLFDLCSPGGLLLLESQGTRDPEATEPDFEAKVLEMTQDRFDLVHRGDICDDAINYREFWLLRRKLTSGA